MEDKIFDIVTDLLRHDISKQEAIDKLLILHNVSDSVCDTCNGHGGRSAHIPLGSIKCPKCKKY